MRYDRVWWTPIQARLLPDTFKLTEVDWREVDLHSHDEGRVSAALCEPALHLLSDPRLAEIAGYGPPTWQTFSTTSLAAQVSDIQVFLEATRSKIAIDDAAQKAWTASFLQPGLVVRHKKQSTWYMALGPMESTCSPGWPLEFSKQGNKTVFQLSTTTSIHTLKFLTCFDPNDYMVWQYDWKVVLNDKVGSSAPEMRGVVGVPKGKPVSLLHGLALS